MIKDERREQETYEDFENIHEEFGKKLEKIVRSNGGVKLFTNDGNRIDFIQLIHAHGLYGIESNSGNKIIHIEELQQCTATGRVYAICEEYNDLMELNFEFVGTKEACLKYLHSEEENNAIN